MIDRFAVAIVLLSLVGIGLSSVSLVNHYKTTASEFCDIDQTFNCDIVNRSIYSKIMGVPVAGIGLAGYVALLGLALVNRQKRMYSTLLIAGGVIGVLFSFYLTYIEARVLIAYCVYCLGSLACIMLITTLAIIRHMRTRVLVF